MRRVSVCLLWLGLTLGGMTPLVAQEPAPGSAQWVAREAQAALEYLNKIRANPAAFSRALGVNLNRVKPRPALVMNAALMKAAQAKAEDMSRRRYFDHVDPDGRGMNIRMYEAGYPLDKSWTKPKSENFFESIHMAAGNDVADQRGVESIKDLVIDEGVDPPGHRQHLLGMEAFWAGCTDFGIGISLRPDADYGYEVNVCVLIAKTKFGPED